MYHFKSLQGLFYAVNTTIGKEISNTFYNLKQYYTTISVIKNQSLGNNP